MLTSLHAPGKKLLICVDEVASTQGMKEFAGTFQYSYIRTLPVFLLMTGLFDNFRRLQDEKTLTLLYRAPRIDMRPLNVGIIADNYRKNLRIEGTRHYAWRR